jgi:amidase
MRRTSTEFGGGVRMRRFADYERYDALGLADLVRRKAESPNDLLKGALERVEARNAAANA